MNSTQNNTAETNETTLNSLRAEMKKALDMVHRIDGSVGTLIRSQWWLDRKAMLEALQGK